MVNGPHEGLEYKAVANGRKLVVSALTDTDCLRANERAFIGKIVGNQIRGKTYVCIAGGIQSTRDMVILIQDINTLIARSTRFAHVNFQGVKFERDIVLTR